MTPDAELAARLGLTRPYTSGPNVGKCPGGAEYGHGMSLTTVHAAGCCAAWDQTRADAARAERDAEVAAADDAGWAGRGFANPYADPELEPESGS
jgi:hypothetical protein